MNVTPPPEVTCYQDLVSLRQRLMGTILVAVDLENTDHFTSHAALAKLSEVGLVSFDLARFGTGIEEGNIHEVANMIAASHWIVDEWNWVTEDTCPAFWHRPGKTKGKSKPHTARPYRFQFMASRRAATPLQAMEEAGEQLVRFQTENAVLDAWGEVDREQEVIVLFWAADLEKKTVLEAQLGGLLDNPHFKFWDLQKWWPNWHRWNRAVEEERRKSQASCRDFLESLGLGGQFELNNAGNDAYAEVLGFCRCLMMTEEEFDRWMRGGFVDTSFELGGSVKIGGTFNQRNELLGRRLPEEHRDRQNPNGGRGGRGGRGGTGGRGRGGRGGSGNSGRTGHGVWNKGFAG